MIKILSSENKGMSNSFHKKCAFYTNHISWINMILYSGEKTPTHRHRHIILIGKFTQSIISHLSLHKVQHIIGKLSS